MSVLPYKGMFRQDSISNIKVTVNENRAPTDESVRLLREVESSIKDKIVDSCPFPSNVLNAQVIKMFDPIYGEKICFLTKLNGEKLFIEINTEMMFVSEEQKVAHIFNKVSEKIAELLLTSLDKENTRSLMGVIHGR